MAKIDWDTVSSFIEGVGATNKTITFPKVQESVKVTNRGNINIIYTIGTKTGTLAPSDAVEVKENLSSLTVRASSGTSEVYVRASEAGTEREEIGSGGGSGADPQLRSEFEGFKEGISSQLAQSETKLESIKTDLTKGKKNTTGFKILLIDDDGNIAFLTKLKPLLDARGLKCDVAINIGFVDDGVTAEKLTGAQLQQFQSEGYGIINHGWKHNGPETQTLEDLQKFADLEKAKFEQYGFNGYEYYVYPGVMTVGNLTVKNVLKQYYKCNFCNTDAPYNTIPLDTMEINRMQLPKSASNLVTARDYLYKCYRENQLAVLFIHSKDLTDTQYTATLLDEIIANGWKITPVKQVIDEQRNIIELGNKGSSHFYLDQNGNAEFSQMNPTIIFDDTIRAKITDYRANCITHQIVRYNTIADMPTPQTGTLETYRFSFADEKYGYQKFRAYDNEDQWIRRYDAVNNVWMPWFKYKIESLDKKPRPFEIFDDFVYQTLTDVNTPWKLNKGTSGVSPSILNGERGVVRLATGGIAGGLLATNGSQIVCAVPVQPDSKNLVVESRLYVNNISGISVNFGLTDDTILEEPFEIGAGNVITSNASNACCFVYDDDANTKQWFACSVKNDADDSGNGTTGIAPTNNGYKTLRIEVNSSGTIATFYVDGVLVKTLNNVGVAPSVNLYATVVANATSNISRNVGIDYILISHDR